MGWPGSADTLSRNRQRIVAGLHGRLHRLYSGRAGAENRTALATCCCGVVDRKPPAGDQPLDAGGASVGHSARKAGWRRGGLAPRPVGYHILDARSCARIATRYLCIGTFPERRAVLVFQFSAGHARKCRRIGQGLL